MLDPIATAAVLDPIAERGGTREKMHEINHTVLCRRSGTREKMQAQNHICFAYETQRSGQHTQVSHRVRAHNTASAAPSVTCSSSMTHSRSAEATDIRSKHNTALASPPLPIVIAYSDLRRGGKHPKKQQSGTWRRQAVTGVGALRGTHARWGAASEQPGVPRNGGCKGWEPHTFWWHSASIALIVVWYGMVWYGMVWYGMVWYGTVWYGMIWTRAGLTPFGVEDSDQTNDNFSVINRARTA